MAKTKTLFKTEVAGFVVELQHGPHRCRTPDCGVDVFTVQYGKQIDSNLDYATAAKKLGEAIMHGLTCEGKMG